MKLFIFIFLSLTVQPSVADWTLINHASNFIFFSSTQDETGVNSFSNMMGNISNQGYLTTTIDLSSIDTKNSKDNLLIQDLLLETNQFNEATISIDLGNKLLDKLDIQHKKTIKIPVKIAFIFHGVSQKSDIELTITRLKNNFLVIKSYEPFTIALTDFNLEQGVERLSKKGFFQHMTTEIPISFSLYFNFNKKVSSNTKSTSTQ